MTLVDGILFVGVTTQDVFISELCYSSDSTAESYRQLHPGHACSCQIASVDPGRAPHRFECLGLCEPEATHPGDIV